MRQMFMRQIFADAISKFQKITRQMLCDKCSKYDVTLIPQKCKPVRTGIVALTRIIFFTINVMRQMFMRQILADAIPKFQKITRQMLCDKCSKNDVTLIPPANVIWWKNYAIPQNADVIWRENSARWGLLYY